MSRFSGKTAIVTGAGSGIGFAVANALIKEGANVMMNDVDPKLVSNFATNANAKGFTCSCRNSADRMRRVELGTAS